MANRPVAVDIVIEITYNVKNPSQSVIRTNAKRRALNELFDDWLIDQIGRGSDKTPVNHKEEYKIKIGLRLANDHFYTESDTGNNTLTCGIIRKVLEILHNLRVLPVDQ